MGHILIKFTMEKPLSVIAHRNREKEHYRIR
jgi:hypothetical protein